MLFFMHKEGIYIKSQFLPGMLLLLKQNCCIWLKIIILYGKEG